MSGKRTVSRDFIPLLFINAVVVFPLCSAIFEKGFDFSKIFVEKVQHS